MSLTIPAPEAIAARATGPWLVSMLTSARSPSSWTRAATTGIASAASVSASTGSRSPYTEAGRVDSAPTSRISAPASTKPRACASAAATTSSSLLPGLASPSPENESGVTLRMPISHVLFPKTSLGPAALTSRRIAGQHPAHGADQVEGSRDQDRLVVAKQAPGEAYRLLGTRRRAPADPAQRPPDREQLGRRARSWLADRGEDRSGIGMGERSEHRMDSLPAHRAEDHGDPP